MEPEDALTPIKSRRAFFENAFKKKDTEKAPLPTPKRSFRRKTLQELVAEDGQQTVQTAGSTTPIRSRSPVATEDRNENSEGATPSTPNRFSDLRDAWGARSSGKKIHSSPAWKSYQAPPSPKVPTTPITLGTPPRPWQKRTATAEAPSIPNKEAENQPATTKKEEETTETKEEEIEGVNGITIAPSSNDGPEASAATSSGDNGSEGADGEEKENNHGRAPDESENTVTTEETRGTATPESDPPDTPPEQEPPTSAPTATPTEQETPAPTETTTEQETSASAGAPSDEEEQQASSQEEQQTETSTTEKPVDNEDQVISPASTHRGILAGQMAKSPEGELVPSITESSAGTSVFVFLSQLDCPDCPAQDQAVADEVSPRDSQMRAPLKEESAEEQSSSEEQSSLNSPMQQTAIAEVSESAEDATGEDSSQPEETEDPSEQETEEATSKGEGEKEAEHQLASSQDEPTQEDDGVVSAEAKAADQEPERSGQETAERSAQGEVEQVDSSPDDAIRTCNEDPIVEKILKLAEAIACGPAAGEKFEDSTNMEQPVVDSYMKKPSPTNVTEQTSCSFEKEDTDCTEGQLKTSQSADDKQTARALSAGEDKPVVWDMAKSKESPLASNDSDDPVSDNEDEKSGVAAEIQGEQQPAVTTQDSPAPDTKSEDPTAETKNTAPSPEAEQADKAIEGDNGEKSEPAIELLGSNLSSRRDVTVDEGSQVVEEKKTDGDIETDDESEKETASSDARVFEAEQTNASTEEAPVAAETSPESQPAAEEATDGKKSPLLAFLEETTAQTGCAEPSVASEDGKKSPLLEFLENTAEAANNEIAMASEEAVSEEAVLANGKTTPKLGNGKTSPLLAYLEEVAPATEGLVDLTKGNRHSEDSETDVQVPPSNGDVEKREGASAFSVVSRQSQQLSTETEMADEAGNNGKGKDDVSLTRVGSSSNAEPHVDLSASETRKDDEPTGPSKETAASEEQSASNARIAAESVAESEGTTKRASDNVVTHPRTARSIKKWLALNMETGAVEPFTPRNGDDEGQSQIPVVLGKDSEQPKEKDVEKPAVATPVALARYSPVAQQNDKAGNAKKESIGSGAEGQSTLSAYRKARRFSKLVAKKESPRYNKSTPSPRQGAASIDPPREDSFDGKDDKSQSSDKSDAHLESGSGSPSEKSGRPKRLPGYSRPVARELPRPSPKAKDAQLGDSIAVENIRPSAVVAKEDSAASEDNEEDTENVVGETEPIENIASHQEETEHVVGSAERTENIASQIDATLDVAAGPAAEPSKDDLESLRNGEEDLDPADLRNGGPSAEMTSDNADDELIQMESSDGGPALVDIQNEEARNETDRETEQLAHLQKIIEEVKSDMENAFDDKSFQDLYGDLLGSDGSSSHDDDGAKAQPQNKLEQTIEETKPPVAVKSQNSDRAEEGAAVQERAVVQKKADVLSPLPNLRRKSLDSQRRRKASAEITRHARRTAQKLREARELMLPYISEGDTELAHAESFVVRAIRKLESEKVKEPKGIQRSEADLDGSDPNGTQRSEADLDGSDPLNILKAVSSSEDSRGAAPQTEKEAPTANLDILKVSSSEDSNQAMGKEEEAAAEEKEQPIFPTTPEHTTDEDNEVLSLSPTKVREYLESYEDAVSCMSVLEKYKQSDRAVMKKGQNEVELVHRVSLERKISDQLLPHVEFSQEQLSQIEYSQGGYSRGTFSTHDGEIVGLAAVDQAHCLETNCCLM